MHPVRLSTTKLETFKVGGSSKIGENDQSNHLSSFDHVEKSPSTWWPPKRRKCNLVILANFSATNGVLRFAPTKEKLRILVVPYNKKNKVENNFYKLKLYR
jgi:hypothetical protein